jgi:hypothetical protein
MERNCSGPSWALRGNFLVLTEEKREDFNFEQFVSCWEWNQRTAEHMPEALEL